MKRKNEMDSTFTVITSILAAVGFSGLLTTYFQSKLSQQTQSFQKQQELRQSRYLSILVQMLAKLDPETHLTKIKPFRSDLNSPKDLDDELLSELLNSFVFADDAVITSLADFINEPYGERKAKSMSSPCKNFLCSKIYSISRNIPFYLRILL